MKTHPGRHAKEPPPLAAVCPGNYEARLAS